jgi:hypothetical protein
LYNRFHLVIVGVGSDILSVAKIWPISDPVRPSDVLANAAAMALSSLCENLFSTINDPAAAEGSGSYHALGNATLFGVRKLEMAYDAVQFLDAGRLPVPTPAARRWPKA